MTMQSNIQPQTTDLGESPFRLDEIFYSRTDERGIIKSGNSIFQRVSGYDWADLLGAPHKIIRHGDMPRGVFSLFWNRIQSGLPVGAYVKNLARDGRPYWVFAIVLPMPKGYLSVRIKPSSSTLAAVKAEYLSLSAQEKAERLTPEEGAQALCERLATLGFSGYLAFMSHSLANELAARDIGLGRPADMQSQLLADIGKTLGKVVMELKSLASTFEALQSIPTNMRIVASRLEPAGGPISAISDNYKIASGEILSRLRAFASQRGNLGAEMAIAVAEGLFLLGCARVQSEAVMQFRQDPRTDPAIDPDAEMMHLTALEESCKARARTGLAQAAAAASKLSRASQDIRRMMLGLDSIRVMGRVESGRLRVNAAGLSATIDQLDRYHAEIKDRLEAITSLSDHICRSTQGYAARST
jgi:PAS domain S-box-containing protein